MKIWELPVRQALNVVWHYLTDGAPKKAVDKLRIDLIRPLPGMAEQVSDEVVSNELDMFRTALGKGL